MNDLFQQLMRDAARMTSAGRLDEATQIIQQALRGKSDKPSVAGKAAVVKLANKRKTSADHEYDTAEAAFAAAEVAHGNADIASNAAADTKGNSAAGRFLPGEHTNDDQTLRYKIFVPVTRAHQHLPLVVMLHGWGQDPDDFAAGTGMNDAARKQGFYVLYPEQSQAANSSRCWNWYQPEDQQRGRGEPAMIATMTMAMMKKYGIDPRRVYIAGLSAGGAMAIIVAEAYPEIFAAVGVHSGLPRCAASNVMEAFTVMQSGGTSQPEHAMGIDMQMSIPTIVFHGDEDQTVHPRNGEQVIAAVLRGNKKAKVVRGISIQGRRYTRASHVDKKGRLLAEHWLVHGAGHAWSGGDAAGSFTDASGPDATAEMLRFFFAQ